MSLLQENRLAGLSALRTKIAIPPGPIRSLRLTLALVGALAVIAVASGAQKVYVVTDQENFGTVNLTTGQYSPIATEAVGFLSITISPNGTLYGVDDNGLLNTINPVTGAVTVGPNASSADGLAARPSDGTLFAQGAQGQLYTVNPTTGVDNFIGGINSSDSLQGGLAFGPGGALYSLLYDSSSAVNRLALRNTTSGAATTVGTNLGSSFYEGLVYSNNSLYAFDFRTNQIDIVTSGAAVPTGVTVGGLALGEAIFAAASGPVSASTPEPGSITTLLSVLLVGSALVARRRRVR